MRTLAAATLVAGLSACARFPPPALSPEPASARAEVRKPVDPLFNTVAALDAATFDAFSNCSAPEQLKKYASYFAPNVEFYHDTGGVTWNRQDMLARTKKNVCGIYRRELVAGSLKVIPIKGFGAIAQGVHRFCQFKTGICEGIADFTIVWRHHGGKWEITRVLSYGHRPNP